MSTLELMVIALIISIIAPVFLSIIMEALRRPPQAPKKLYWSHDIPIQYISVNGLRMRYIKSGFGPNLVLLHTIRSQLDIFEKVVPELSKTFTVYALDYPGHGFSETLDVDYVPSMFTQYVEKFLDELNIRDAILSGISIGGVITLLIAAKHNPKVRGVVSVNPYDYDEGMGVTRGNFIAWLIIKPTLIPILGETFMRFRIKLIEKIIFQGGVSRNNALTDGFIDLMYRAGEQRGRYRSLINLFRNGKRWEEARDEYKNINIPVKVVYGDQDWSNEDERQRTINAIPNSTTVIIKEGGHFLSMDQPEALIAEIKSFATTINS
jgi:pimeloyl-ACP methyl ester carboxylesterase